MDREREAALSDIIMRGSDDKAREEAITELVEANLRLAARFANRAHRMFPSVPLEDLFQEASLGLWEAAKRFDHTRGSRFGGYAVMWVNKRILAFLPKNTDIITLPPHALKWVRQLRSMLLADASDGSSRTVADVAEEANMDEWLVESLLARSNGVLYAEDIRGANLTNRKWEDLVEAPDMGQADVLDDDEKMTRVVTEIDGLVSQQRDVIQRRFGLNGFKCQTLAEIGEHYGVSRERVRQIQRKALQTLRFRTRAVS
jgi:RNA polymerase sigma factor (sigma-70 family)